MNTNTTARKMAIICNHTDVDSVMPVLIMASSGLSLDYEVVVFFSPGGALAMVQGELEKFQGLNGYPDPIKLFNDIRSLGGRMILCELAFATKLIRPEQIREGVEVMKAPPFLMAAEGATMTLTF
jgi:predicted peroxiredoxin